VTQNNPEFDQAARTASLVGQIGCVTGFASMVIIGLAFGIGRLLDSLLGTSGIFTILFLLGSFPITLYVIVRISLWTLARAQRAVQQPKADKKQEDLKEEAE
jgi:F0F1-type ATP synthase assembly protein I